MSFLVMPGSMNYIWSACSILRGDLTTHSKKETVPSASSRSSSSLWQEGWGQSNPSAYAPAYFFTKASNGTSAKNKTRPDLSKQYIPNVTKYFHRRRNTKNLCVVESKLTLTFLGELHELLFLLSSYFHGLLLLYSALLILVTHTYTHVQLSLGILLLSQNLRA